jgi:hypothetical protein
VPPRRNPPAADGLLNRWSLTRANRPSFTSNTPCSRRASRMFFTHGGADGRRFSRPVDPPRTRRPSGVCFRLRYTRLTEVQELLLPRWLSGHRLSHLFEYRSSESSQQYADRIRARIRRPRRARTQGCARRVAPLRGRFSVAVGLGEIHFARRKRLCTRW